MLETLSLLPPNHEILRQNLPRFDFSNPPINPVELYNAMGNFMVKHGGIGLAANQVGLPYRFLVIASSPIIGMFNPIIVDFSDDKTVMQEACLSFPNISLKIERPQVIRVRYTDPAGETKTAKFQDLTSRAIQHEIDHLNGITIGQRVGRTKLEMAIKSASKSGTKYLIKDLI